VSQKFMVFDVESIGLHGEGFAVGWVEIDERGEEVGCCQIACEPKSATGTEEGRKWVADHCRYVVNAKSPREVREGFWSRWMALKSKGYMLAADCAWPVEANFLSACVRENFGEREWHGPYPLIDVASVRLAAGLDPLAEVERTYHETPAHDPHRDARQSARLLLEALALTAKEVAV
jgi:hypothetical protein